LTVITAALRTPIGKFGGAMSSISATDMAAQLISALIEQSNCPAQEVDEVILGNVLQAGQGQGPARQAVINAGLPNTVPATSINMLCGSGLKAVSIANSMINSGQADVVIAGGMENMSASPFLLPEGRWGKKLGDSKLIDSLLNDGLIDAFDRNHMAMTAEKLAEELQISRKEQDEFAARSQRKAERAILDKRFDDEIIPVEVNENGHSRLINRDEYPRSGVTAKQLAELPAAFTNNGTVTAGNASGINDGAAVLLLMSDEKAEKLKVHYKAEILSTASTGLDPAYMGLGPVSATNKALAKASINLNQIELIELNEAFAAQAIAACRQLDLPDNIVNVNGGAIALGHPIGASGARILVTLYHEMKKRNSSLGLASLCIGGGMGEAVILKS